MFYKYSIYLAISSLAAAFCIGNLENRFGIFTALISLIAADLEIS